MDLLSNLVLFRYPDIQALLRGREFVSGFLPPPRRHLTPMTTKGSLRKDQEKAYLFYPRSSENSPLLEPPWVVQRL